jgi:uncharacterized protein YecE (DUF72 family)
VPALRNVLVGTSSWTDKTLIDSGKFYPRTARTPEDRLKYYASRFPIVEIDSSYYGLPSEENAQRWIDRTPPSFVFNIKGYRLFTRHQTPVVSLPADLREALGPVSRKNVYDKDVPEEIRRELWARFRRVLDMLRGAGKLGAVHMQFAPWVAFHTESFDHIEYCRAMLAGFTVAVEFRNATWFNSERHSKRTLEFERDNGFVNVIVDEPQGIANTIPAVWEITNPELAVVRLHGRNHGTWNLKGLKASSQRFDYDYNEGELEELAGQVRTIAPKARRVHVLFNNNYEDQGQRGAAALAQLLQGAPI